MGEMEGMTRIYADPHDRRGSLFAFSATARLKFQSFPPPPRIRDQALPLSPFLEGGGEKSFPPPRSSAQKDNENESAVKKTRKEA